MSECIVHGLSRRARLKCSHVLISTTSYNRRRLFSMRTTFSKVSPSLFSIVSSCSNNKSDNDKTLTLLHSLLNRLHGSDKPNKYHHGILTNTKVSQSNSYCYKNYKTNLTHSVLSQNFSRQQSNNFFLWDQLDQTYIMLSVDLI